MTCLSYSFLENEEELIEKAEDEEAIGNLSVNENQEVSFPYFSFSSLLTCRSSSDTITKQVECRFLIGLRIVLVVAILMAFGRLKPHVQPSLFSDIFQATSCDSYLAICPDAVIWTRFGELRICKHAFR